MDRMDHVSERSSEGTFRMEFEDGKSPRMYADEHTKTAMGVSLEASAEECYHIWANGVEQSYVEPLWKMRRVLIKGEEAECTYQWIHPVYGRLFVRSRGYGIRRGNTDYLYGRHEVLKDTVIIERENLSQNIVEALTDVYKSAYLINLKSKTSQALKNSIYSRQMLAGIHDATKSFEQFITVMVKPEYREKLRVFCDLATLDERLNGLTHLACEFDGTRENSRCRATFVPVYRDENNRVTDVLFLIEVIGFSLVRKDETPEFSDLLLQQKVANLVTPSEVMGISLIDALTGDVKATSYKSTPKDTKVNLRDMSYYDCYVTERDREIYHKMLDVHYLSEQVENDGHYAITITSKNDRGEYRNLTNHFTKLDDTTLLSVLEDNTDTIHMDALTDCMNKAGFLQRMMIYLPSAKPGIYTVLAFNVEKFKAINRQYGYDVGDAVLKEIVERLNRSSLMPLAVGHEMADSFFCLVRSENLTIQEIERLCHFTVTIGNEELPVVLDCGIYQIEECTENRNVILDKARMVCRNSEHNASHCWSRYDEAQNRHYLEQAYIIRNVKHAISAGQFEAVYQPIFDAKTAKPVSAEVLVRWNHPIQGFISPAMFLPAVEQSGYMLDLDKYVAKTAWSFLKKRMDAPKHTLPLTLNMSRFDFFHPGIAEQMSEVLKKFPDISQWISVEITESGVEDISKDAKDMLAMFKEHKIKLLIDDFGSGYSSFGMLANFDCDCVKLDMSFVRDIGVNPKAEKVIQSIIACVHSLDRKIVAEGVETKAQYEFLKTSDCDYIQGYYFSKPLREAEYAALLDREGQ